MKRKRKRKRKRGISAKIFLIYGLHISLTCNTPIRHLQSKNLKDYLYSFLMFENHMYKI